MAAGSLWLAGCKEEIVQPTPAPVPTLTSFTPGSGAPGTTVTLTGTNFTGATTVRLGGVAVPFTVVSSTTITFVVPMTNVLAGALDVATPGGRATHPTPFTVLPPASTITSITPGSALPGATVTLTGTNFDGATSVTLGGVAVVFTVTSPTTITLTVPQAAETGLFVITTPGGTGTSLTPFTVLPLYVNVGAGDLGVLNLAYALEQLEAAFYAAVKAGSYYRGASQSEKTILEDLASHEIIHRELFRAALAGSAIKTLEPNFSTINFSDRTAVLYAARTFEDLGVAAYNGAAQYLTNPDYLALLAKIVSVEARHAALIRDLLTNGTFVGADVVSPTTGLELTKSLADVAVQANTYLAAGSWLDVAGLR